MRLRRRSRAEKSLRDTVLGRGSIDSSQAIGGKDRHNRRAGRAAKLECSEMSLAIKRARQRSEGALAVTW